jgi:hypothetical protein
MTSLHLVCPVCRLDLGIPGPDVVLEVHPILGARVLFDCPRCCRTVGIDIPPHLVSVVRGAGARMSGASGAPPITYDELLEFHQALDRPDWDDELTSW